MLIKRKMKYLCGRLYFILSYCTTAIKLNIGKFYLNILKFDVRRKKNDTFLNTRVDYTETLHDKSI